MSSTPTTLLSAPSTSQPSPFPSAIHRFAAYGTLQPTGPNSHVLQHLAGRWIPGYVHGKLHAGGWGAEMGYPGIHLAPKGKERVELMLLESEALVGEWERLDGFEGEEYERVVVEVVTEEGRMEAQIYALKK